MNIGSLTTSATNQDHHVRPMRLSPKSPPVTLLLTSVCCLLPGCSIRRMVVDQTADVLKGAMPAFERDWDFDLVEAALPANIKMIEGLLEAGPDNRDLLLMASQAYGAFGLIFVEDQLEQAEEDTPAWETLRARGKEMHLRGHRYGMRLLETTEPGFKAAFDKGGEALDQALARCEAEDVPGLFWSGMPLFAAVNLDREDVDMIAMIPKAKALVQRVQQLDETYYHAGAHMILGAMLGSMAKSLGGDPPKGKLHFETALKLTKRRFLLVQVMYAKTVAVQTMDAKLFTSLLQEVARAELGIFPEQKLANVAAKRRAKRLLEQQDELF